MIQWFRIAAALGAFGCVTQVGIVHAQDLRVHTTVRDLSGSGASKSNESDSVVARSLMLFHAGKIYDYVDPAQEVIVFEPAHHRFTVMNQPRQLRSELTQDEIRQYLGLVEKEAQRRIEEDLPSPSRKPLELLQFQLQPNFATTFDSKKNHLQLGSPHLQYTVSTSTPPSAEIAEKYLFVADWTAQLNSVLHPQSMLPAARLKLNEELRQRTMIPLSVELKADAEPGLHLQARHEWTWQLEKTDRQLIDEWERQLQGAKLKTLPFRAFQQEMLKVETAKRR